MQTKPIPIALPTDLLAQIDQAHQLTGLSKADIMRLCMRIGLVDLRAAEHDFPGIVKRIADDKGVSFQAFADAKQKEEDLCTKEFTMALNRVAVSQYEAPKRGFKLNEKPSR